MNIVTYELPDPNNEIIYDELDWSHNYDPQESLTSEDQTIINTHYDIDEEDNTGG